jgi:hypothetical protein
MPGSLGCDAPATRRHDHNVSRRTVYGPTVCGEHIVERHDVAILPRYDQRSQPRTRCEATQVPPARSPHCRRSRCCSGGSPCRAPRLWSKSPATPSDSYRDNHRFVVGRDYFGQRGDLLLGPILGIPQHGPRSSAHSSRHVRTVCHVTQLFSLHRRQLHTQQTTHVN